MTTIRVSDELLAELKDLVNKKADSIREFQGMWRYETISHAEALEWMISIVKKYYKISDA